MQPPFLEAFEHLSSMGMEVRANSLIRRGGSFYDKLAKPISPQTKKLLGDYLFDNMVTEFVPITSAKYKEAFVSKILLQILLILSE